MSELPDLLDDQGVPVNQFNARKATKQEALTLISYYLTANGFTGHGFVESSKEARLAEMEGRGAEDVDWSKEQRIHLYGEDAETGMPYCITFKPRAGARIFCPPSYKLDEYQSATPEDVRQVMSGPIREDLSRVPEGLRRAINEANLRCAVRDPDLPSKCRGRVIIQSFR